MKKDLIEYDVTTAAIEEMKKKYTGMKITNIASDKVVRAARTFMVSKRTAVEKRRVELNAEANDWRKKVNDKAKEITALLLPIEEPLQAECKRIDDEIKARREEKEAKERERIEKIQEKINWFSRLSIVGHSTSSSTVEESLVLLRAIEIPEEVYMEFMDQAIEAQKNSISALENILTERLQFEKEVAERDAEAQRLEAQRKEQETAQAKIDEANRKIQEEKDEFEAERRAENERKEREAFESRAKIQAEADAKENARQKAEEAEALAAVEVEEKARKAAMTPDKEKLIKWVLSFNETNNPSPQLKSKEAKEILRLAKETIESVLQAAEDEIEKL